MPFFITIIVLVIIFHLRLRYLQKNFPPVDNTQYLKEDFEANFSRTRPIDENMFIRLSESELPFRYDYDPGTKTGDEILRIQEKVKHNLAAPIIKTDIPTNIEVKKRFGASNLQAVADGEENHTRLLRNLNAWAKLLIEHGDTDSAEAVLEKAVWARSDISGTYIQLIELYRRTGRQGKIEELNGKIAQLPDIAKKRIDGFTNQ